MTTSDVSAPRARPALQTLMGGRASAGLASDMLALLALPEAAREGFWEALQGCLGPKFDDRAITRLQRYGKQFEIDHETLLGPVKACRFLLKTAARNNTPRESFEVDIKNLAGPAQADALVAVAMPLYDKAFVGLRQEVVFRSIAEHGTVARDVHWRVGTLHASDHGVALNVPLTSLTFACQNGQTSQNITIELLPDMLAKLRKICDEALRNR